MSSRQSKLTVSCNKRELEEKEKNRYKYYTIVHMTLSEVQPQCLASRKSRAKTKCMNGTGSKYGIHVRERRWTAGVAEYIWMVLKTFQSSHGAVLCRRRRTDLEAETLGRWIELNAEGRIRWRGEDESDTVSQTFTLEIPRSLFMINFPSVTLTDSWI